MQAPKTPFVSLAGPFAPSGNTILVTGGASGAYYVIAHCMICVETSSGIGLALAVELLKLGNTVCLLCSDSISRHYPTYTWQVIVCGRRASALAQAEVISFVCVHSAGRALQLAVPGSCCADINDVRCHCGDFSIRQNILASRLSVQMLQ